MAGIYIHIPFCKQACHYCDFHFSTSLRHKSSVVTAICQEIALQQQYLGNQTINTIYFGGGTPSLLSSEELLQIFSTLHRCFNIAPDAEITLEANPDDLTKAKLQELAASPVNRLSIGIQSFHEEHLRRMNRAHNAQEAYYSVLYAQDAGFTNITTDLIYGIPAPSHELWLADLTKLFSLQVQHVSCYALTIEEKTALGRWTKKGSFKPSEDEFVAEQFEILVAQMQAHGFTQYEISNFCLPGFESKHNSNYWRGVHYLGLGPSAHSFNSHSRQYNVANNAKYLTALTQNQLAFEREELTVVDQANEYLLTSLRTIWGCDLNRLRQFGVDLRVQQKEYLDELLQKEYIRIQDEVLYLTDKGKLLADQITLDLFLEPQAQA
ncbi:radical SAM family heme chaperone HemW [Adhaeribacter rhizoryzae]|uniref:Heme chaperone HemW n=1 Tax=Adhaeribacter rhizoryzae TaxID=2607907 RepID=A0A5M6D6F0_9BACT|nr:radical SAM family heme chaperone HemW [Adhaeribacter rhizoryzae]KAA5542316.1 radical SAM family heme chaperone HemW [Adhaeribacter rhizoryzae]